MNYLLLLDRIAPKPTDAPWELAAEAISIKIRWFGLVVGFALANFGSESAYSLTLNFILLVGFLFTSIDTLAFRAGRVFLRDAPLGISAMEALFISLLCAFESGEASPFRFYYLLSLICTAIRYTPRITFLTCVLDCVSYTLLFLSQPHELREFYLYLLTLIILIWATWAAVAMARYLKTTEIELRNLNRALRENQTLLEDRITERSRQLEETQAQVLHQEKMAAFGLLAAGIAHEVGNPLTSISGIIQMLEQRDPDEYTQTKLRLVTAELARIQSILKELVSFSRPTTEANGFVEPAEFVHDALRIAKFYKGGKNRRIVAIIPDNIPKLHGVRDHFVQVVFNLVLNGIDATEKGGTIEVKLERDHDENCLILSVSDDGHGISVQDLPLLFKPYFTTKKHGTGLGLFVIRRIVENYGGSVDVSSTVNQGTTFRIYLPLPSPSTDGRTKLPSASTSASNCESEALPLPGVL